MRRNKLLALGLAGAMTMTALAGCGSTSTHTTTAAAGSTAAGQSEAGTTEATKKEKAQISMLAIDFNGNAGTTDHADEAIALMEEHTNTTVKFQWAYNDTYAETLGTTLTDRDNMPMILSVSGNLSANIINAAKAGAFWDLSEVMFDSSKYPNLSQANKDVCNSLTVDGELIGVYRARDIGRYGMSYRKDWAEAVGITETPKTIDDVYDMMYKFTYNDPDGNGVNDTYGLEMCKYTGVFDVIQTWFGCGNGWVEKDGELVPVHETDEYMEALDWLKKCFEEGLFPQNFAEIDSGTFSDMCKKGQAGVFADMIDGGRRIWDYFINEDVKSVVNPEENASMELVGAINGHTLATSGFNGFFIITKDGAKTEEDLANCLHFLDAMGDDEMLTLTAYGLEGIDYTIEKEDGKDVVVKTAENLAAGKNTANSGLNQLEAYIPNAEPKVTVVKTERQIKQAEVYAANEKVAVFNPALGYLANSETYASYGADLDDVISTARTQYIAGQITKEQLQEQFKVWDQKGGTQVKEEVNAQFKANKK